jgi:hypothetical protein
MEERAKLFAIPERLTSIAAWTRILASRHWRKRVASWSAFPTPRLPVVIGARALPRTPARFHQNLATTGAGAPQPK